MFWEVLIATIGTLIFGTFFGYVVHRALHNKRLGRFYKSHLIHHFKLYPARDFTSEIYRDAGKDNTTWIFLIASLPIGLIPVIFWLFGVLSGFTAITLLIEMSLIGFLNSWLHDTFHITNHWLNHIPFIGSWYKKLIRLHYEHHVDVKKNFGIFSFVWDRIFHTLR